MQGSFILVIVITLLTQVARANSAGSSHVAMVDVLCDFLSTRNSKSLKNDEIWVNFAQHLEKRESFEGSPEALSEGELFKGCVAKYRERIDLGEFLITGLAQLENQLEQFKVLAANKPPLFIPVASFEEGREPSTPEVVLVYNEVSPTPDLVSEERMHNRVDQYKSLWISFLNSLRESLLSGT